MQLLSLANISTGKTPFSVSKLIQMTFASEDLEQEALWRHDHHCTLISLVHIHLLSHNIFDLVVDQRQVVVDLSLKHKQHQGQ